MKNYINAIIFHCRIVWRPWSGFKNEDGKRIALRIDWATAWKVAKNVWLK